MVGEGQGEGEEEEELEWLSNKDAFPSVDTMAAEVESAAPGAPARAAVGPRTKGLRRRRRVTAPWSLAPFCRARVRRRRRRRTRGAAAPVHPLRRG